MPSSTATVRVPTASSSARSWETSSSVPSNASSASSSASRLSMSRWFVGSSRIRTFAPHATRIASDSRRRSPPRQPVERLLGLLAAEEEAPEQRARLVRRQPGVHRARLDDLVRPPARPPAELLGVLREMADLHVVACRELAARERPHARERVDERRLAGAVGSDERHVLAALEPQLGAVEQHLRRIRADLDAPADQLEDDAPRALRRLEVELQPLAVARVALDALDLVQALDARLRLLGLRRLRPEALDERARAARSRPAACRSRAPSRSRARPARCATASTCRGSSASGRPRARARRCRRPRGTSGRARRGRSPRRARRASSRAIRATRCRGGSSARRAAAGRDLPRARARATRA